jgi:hypothetical protein
MADMAVGLLFSDETRITPALFPPDAAFWRPCIAFVSPDTGDFGQNFMLEGTRLFDHAGGQVFAK